MATRCLTPLEVSKLLGCSRSQVELIAALPAVRIGTRALAVTEGAYEAFLDARSTASAA